jgi:hypothetical protein
MDRATHDERMRRLQQLAYGATSSDADRAAAIAELEAIRLEQAGGRPRAADAPTAPAPPRPRGVESSVRPEGDASDPGPAMLLRWAIAAGAAAALLIGVAVGWQAGARVDADGPTPAVVSTTSELDASRIPIGDTAVPRLYEVEPSPADMPQDAYPRDSIAPTEYRLLRSRPDGVSLYVARLHGGTAVCAVVTQPGEFTASSCTHDGMFPRAGLWVEVFVEGDIGLVRGAIRPDGGVELSPSGYVPGPLPTVDG